MTSSTDTNKARGRIAKRLLLVILIMTNSYFLYKFIQYRNVKENIELKIEADNTRITDLERNLEQTISELAKYKEISIELNELLKKSYDQITELKTIISGLQDQSGDSKLKGRVRELINLTEKYLAQIDSLLKENQLLSQRIEKEKNLSLTLKNERDALKQRFLETNDLMMENVNITGVMGSSNADEKRSNIIKDIIKLKICFDVKKRNNSKGEGKEVAIKIINPNNQVIIDPNHPTVDGKVNTLSQSEQYSTKVKIDYNNIAKNFCIYILKNEQFIPGNYNAMFYCDGVMVNSADFILK